MGRKTKGCTQTHAQNFDPAATSDDGSCVGQDPCIKDSSGKCLSCPAAMCTSPDEPFDGFRSDTYDLIYATRVADGSILIDGQLDEPIWEHMPLSRRYTDIPFAQKDGKLVFFETNDGGIWFGPEDFSYTAMLAWDSTRLYLALDVADDQMRADQVCYKQGVQVGFEVGGENSQDANGRNLTGVLQAKRSEDLKVSRLDLINVGFPQSLDKDGADFNKESWKTISCVSPPDNHAGQPVNPAETYDSLDQDLDNKEQETDKTKDKPPECCIQYEKNNGDGWRHLTAAAITRDEVAKRTRYELAFSKFDLLGDDAPKLKRW